MQAVWTGSDQPVFDAILPRPLYSLAAGHTHVFLAEPGELLQSRILLV